MAEIVNLNRARKQRRRAADEAEAERNRAKHGRTKAERANARAASDRLGRVLDGARRADVSGDDPGEGS